MRKTETLKTINRILKRRESELKNLQATVAALRTTLRELEDTEDDLFNKSQNGTYQSTITDAIVEVLADGPLHRSVVLERIEARGVHVGGGVRTIGVYLSKDDRFVNVGKGVWALEQSPAMNGDDSGEVVSDSRSRVQIATVKDQRSALSDLL